MCELINLQGISAARNLTHLDLGHPDLQNFANVETVALPRISPELEYLVPERQAGAAGAVTGNGGWGLGPGWENLEVLKAAGLSQNGVRSATHGVQLPYASTEVCQAKTLATHLQLLCSRTSPSIAELDISTHFLDATLATAISDYGQLGSLKHLTLATSGTRLTSDCLQQALEGCTSLESFKLKDSEGELTQLSSGESAHPNRSP